MNRARSRRRFDPLNALRTCGKFTVFAAPQRADSDPVAPAYIPPVYRKDLYLMAPSSIRVTSICISMSEALAVPDCWGELDG